jgi:DNA segregation ATPase FtsK/SpoIIIE, S-DNA-T family
LAKASKRQDEPVEVPLGGRVARDVQGVLLGVVALLLLLSLISFTPEAERANWVGFMGYWTGYATLILLGVGAYLLVPFASWVGVSLVLWKRVPSWPQWLASLGALVLVPTLLRLGFDDARLQGVTVSGDLGMFVGEVVRRLLGTVGGTILVSMLMVVVLMVISGDPLEVWMRRAHRLVATPIRGVASLLRGAWGLLRGAAASRAERRARRAESEPIEPDPPSRSPLSEHATHTLDADGPEIAEPAIPSAELAGAPMAKPLPRKKRAKKDPIDDGPEIVEPDAMRQRQHVLDLEEDPRARDEQSEYVFPPTTALDYQPPAQTSIMKGLLKEKAELLERTLSDFKIKGKVVKINPGPVITMFEYLPDRGVKLSKIANLADDLTLSLKALKVRIVAPIPGKGVVGIEVPNEHREIVYMKEVVLSDAFRKHQGKLPVCLGNDIFGNPTTADLAKMPHLLVAGATGSGKSVGLNAIITSLLYHATPDDVKMIMIDPKMLELSIYQGIPHLMTPVVTDMKQASTVLRWAVAEMEGRYKLMSKLGVRNIDQYNEAVDEMKSRGAPAAEEEDEEERFERYPYVVLIIDEFADLMTVASKDVETSVVRIAQMARAAGLHLIMATQRPSVDVITGVIKANLPTRIAFQVASKIDSRTILDMAGAENLLGNGDMLYLPPGTSKLMRVHGALVTTKEIQRVVDHVKTQRKPRYDLKILEEPAEERQEEAEEHDELYEQSKAVAAETGNVSISYIQRRLKIGYNRAARIIERMEREGIVGPSDGSRPREVYIDRL